MTTFYGVTPLGAGAKNGGPTTGTLSTPPDWANAASLAELAALVAAAPADSEFWLRADLGVYVRTGAIALANAAANLAGPIRFRGTDKDGVPMRALIVGNRVDPWPKEWVAGTVGGNTLFQLRSGYLWFRDIVGRDFGEMFKPGDGLTATTTMPGIRIRDCYGHNLDYFIEQAPGVDEQQQVAITGSPTGGTFTLTFEGQTTAPIAYNANAAAITAALNALSNVNENGQGDVAATGGPLPDAPVTVTFSNFLGRSDRTQMTADATGLTGGSSPAVVITTTRAGYSLDLVGLKVARCGLAGYTGKFARIKNGSNDIDFEDCWGDAESQDDANAGTKFPSGIVLLDRVNNVRHRRCHFRSGYDVRNVSQYWNGDGFTAEYTNDNILYEDCSAEEFTDAGFDLKSTNTRLVRTVVRGCKRNYRFHSATDFVLEDCASFSPRRVGGSGNQAHLALAFGDNINACGVTAKRCLFDDDDPRTAAVFEFIDNSAAIRLTVKGGTVRKSDTTPLTTALGSATFGRYDLAVTSAGP